MLGRGNSKENVRHLFDNVSFIVFNYDRCLEHFLFTSLPKLYAISEDDAASIVQDVNIIHPYGLVAEFSRQPSRTGVPFGGATVRYSENYIDLAQNVKTYTEQNIDKPLLKRLAHEFATAECIVFLGFAYHPQNLSLLRPPKPIERAPVFGTALGFSKHDANIIGYQIEKMSQGRGVHELRIADWVTIDTNATCAKLFDDYGKSILDA